MTAPVNPDQLRITVEMGDQFQPSERLASALTELQAALSSVEDAEVEGFALSTSFSRSFSFDSKTDITKPGDGSVFPKVESNIFHKLDNHVYKF